jgi:hypothetical protein
MRNESPLAQSPAARALGIVCPLCRAGAGRPCISQSQLYRNGWMVRTPITIKRPHRQRISKAAE